MILPKESVSLEHLSPIVRQKLDKSGGSTASTTITTGATSTASSAISVHAVSVSNYALTGTPSAIDGITPQAGVAYLLAGQTNKKDNGIWILKDAQWIRSSVKLIPGMLVSVRAGTDNANSVWMLSAPIIGDIQSGITDIEFEFISQQLSGTDNAIQVFDATTSKLKSILNFVADIATSVFRIPLILRLLKRGSNPAQLTMETADTSPATVSITAPVSMGASYTIVLPDVGPALSPGGAVSVNTSGTALIFSSRVEIQPSNTIALRTAIPNSVSGAGQSWAGVFNNNSLPATGAIGHGILLSSNAHEDAFALLTTNDVLTGHHYNSGSMFNLESAVAISSGNNQITLASRATTRITTTTGTPVICSIQSPSLPKNGTSYNRRARLIYTGNLTITIKHNDTVNGAVGSLIFIENERDLVAIGPFALDIEYSQAFGGWRVVSFRGRQAVTADVAAQTSVAVSGTAGATYNSTVQLLINNLVTQGNANRTDIANVRTAVNQILTALRNQGLIR